ncbi:MAG TPA: hypothetical protein VKA85_09650 [Candidatus Limnocylindrales bacterium]|nr:hypothetical protein [Candidatus Limnocylindrales bacterium]
MDPAIAPLLLFAFVAAMAGTWMELRTSLEPVRCSECPHCREALAVRQREADEDARRQRELSSWYARRNGLDDRDDDDRMIG